MDKRFTLAAREARFALYLTFAYLLGWLLTAYLPDDTPGITGLPRWFELSCVLLPVIFLGLCWLMVKCLFKDIPLEDDDVR